jgi:type I restriction enzyme, R subunit
VSDQTQVVEEYFVSPHCNDGDVLDYFNAIKLGLTATPRDVVDHNTFALFECEDGLPTFPWTNFLKVSLLH